MRVHDAVCLERTDAEVDRCRRIPDQHLRRVGGRLAVDRLELREAREDRRLGPCWLAQLAIHGDVRLDARGRHVELLFSAAVCGPGVDDVRNGEQCNEGAHASWFGLQLCDSRTARAHWQREIW